MSSTAASNAWAEIVHHASDGILEERWLPGQMTDWRVHGEFGIIGARSREATAIRNPDRCNAISVSTRALGHGMAEQLHNPSLWFGWRSEIASRCAVIQSPSVRPNNRPRPRAER
jgi:hypothetical protein